MNDIIYPVLVLFGVGLVSAVVLVIASKVMHVPTDKTADELAECLPQANCGACGFAGCYDYACAVAKGNAPVGQCTPGGDKAAAAMANVLGVEAVDVVEKIAVVRCRGSLDKTTDKFEYVGVKNCAGAVMMFSGNSACKFGCLGYGDCMAACKFGAITVSNGLARVDPDVCTGCGACAKACPKSIIEIMPAQKRAMVLCLNEDKGAVTHRICTAGCIACGKCTRVCPQEAIFIADNRAHVDATKCSGCGQCVSGCPTGAIGMLLKEQQPAKLPDVL